jgi:S1 RNA binding domain
MSLLHGENHAEQLIPSARLPCAVQTGTDSLEQNRAERSEKTAHEALLNQPHSPVCGTPLDVIVLSYFMRLHAFATCHHTISWPSFFYYLQPSSISSLHNPLPFLFVRLSRQYPPSPHHSSTSSSSPPLGTITGLRNYGAFLELDGGMAGLLHISQISYERVDSLETLFTIGQRCKVRCSTA